MGLLLVPSSAASEPPVVVPVTVAVDDTFRADARWTRFVARAFAGASELVGAPLGIRFKVERRAGWAPAGASLDDYLGRLRAQVGVRPGGIVVGLTGRRPPPRSVFGATDYVNALVVLSVPSAEDDWDRKLAHELGHVFGAIDTEGGDELMAGHGGGLRVDAMNARLMDAHRQRRFPPAAFPLQGPDLDAVARLYREAALFAPAEAYPALIRVERARGDLEAALHDAVRLAAVRPEGRSFDLRAQVLADLAAASSIEAALEVSAGGAPGAVADRTRAVREDPEVATGWLNLAAGHLRLGRDREAEQAAREELKLRPRSPRALATLALVRQLRGDLAGAIELQERAAELAPDDAGILTNLGILEVQAGRRSEALQTHLRVLELRPDDGRCHNDVAVLYFREGQLDAARRHASRALELGAPVSSDFLAALERAPGGEPRPSPH